MNSSGFSRELKTWHKVNIMSTFKYMEAYANSRRSEVDSFSLVNNTVGTFIRLGQSNSVAISLSADKELSKNQKEG